MAIDKFQNRLNRSMEDHVKEYLDRNFNNPRKDNVMTTDIKNVLDLVSYMIARLQKEGFVLSTPQDVSYESHKPDIRVTQQGIPDVKVKPVSNTPEKFEQEARQPTPVSKLAIIPKESNEELTEAKQLNRTSVTRKPHTKVFKEPVIKQFHWCEHPVIKALESLLVGQTANITLEETHPDAKIQTLQSAVSHAGTRYFGIGNSETHIQQGRKAISLTRKA